MVFKKASDGATAGAGSGGIESFALGSEAWNVADGYTKIKILRLLIKLDMFENIALYGTEDLDDNILAQLSLNDIAKRRQEGIHRIVTTLRQLLGNVKFAITGKFEQEKIERYLERIEAVEDVLDGIMSVEENYITHEMNLVINELHFRKCMKVLSKIKDEINFPINKAGLIFRKDSDIDLDKLMSDIVQGG